MITRFSIVIVVCSFSSCADHVADVLNDLTPLDQMRLEVKQIGYSEYVVSPVSRVASPVAIKRIELWCRADSSVFDPSSIDSFQTVNFPGYFKQRDQFPIDFSISGSFVRPSSLEETITIRFYSETDSLIFSLDTTVSTFKYPYTSTETVLAGRFYIENSGNYYSGPFQSLTFVGDTLYFVTLGATYIFRYNQLAANATLLLDYGGGDHIASDSNYLFVDFQHSLISRWNTTTGLDEGFIIDFGPAPYIHGMDIMNGQLVILAGPSSSERYLIYSDYSGNMTTPSPFQIPGYHLAIRDSILHTRDSNSHRIFRYTFGHVQLPSYVAPVSRFSGIRFHGNYLYFCDNDRAALGRVPINDLILTD